jgi:hypothetical protein
MKEPDTQIEYDLNKRISSKEINEKIEHYVMFDKKQEPVYLWDSKMRFIRLLKPEVKEVDVDLSFQHSGKPTPEECKLLEAKNAMINSEIRKIREMKIPSNEKREMIMMYCLGLIDENPMNRIID